MRLPKIGTAVRAHVSVFHCPEGTTGIVKAILVERDGPEVLIETYPRGEVAVAARHYGFFFDEGVSTGNSSRPAANETS